MQNYQFDWLGKDWQKLKKQLVVLCTAHADCFSDKQLTTKDLELFVSTVLNDIKARSIQDEIGLWQEALALFINFDLLYKSLESGLKPSFKDKDIIFNQALGQSLNYFFEDARRELLALELDDSPARIKTWERLNRFSNKLAKNTHFSNLCSEEYFEYLLNVINQECAGDYNYPHKLDTIRSYFFKFSQDCKKLEVQADDSQLNCYSKEDIFNIIGEDLFSGKEKQILSQCLPQLDKQDLELLDVAFGLEINPTQYLSEKAYQKAKKYNKKQYEEAKTNALKNLNSLFDTQYYGAEQ